MATGYKADGVITIGTSVDVGGINTGLKKITKSMDKISSMAKSILGIGLFTKLGNEAINYASDLTEVENIVDVSFKSMRSKIDTFTKTCIEMYGISELTAKQTAGSFAAMGNAMNLTLDESTSMAVQLTQLSADMASFYNISQDYARVALSAVYTGETETLKRYGVVLTEANLQEYAQTLGIEKSVKAMSAREKLILRYKYIMHTMNDIQGDFANTSGTWANQIRVLQERWRQFLIVLGTGLKSVLLPVIRALNTALQVTISWAKAIGAVLARLFGIKFEDTISGTTGALDDVGTSANDAADAEGDLADSTEAAGKAAEKALGPYDKLNVIQKDTASGSKGNGGIGGDALDLDFSDLDLGSGTSIFDKIKDDLLDINSFYELGRYISDNLTNMLRNIPWDKIYEGARNFGTNLADFLNGLITPELFYEVGATIAKTLNTVIYTALSFATRFDWANLGKSLAAGVNGLFENWDAAATAQAISKWVEGIWKLILNFFANLDYKMIFHKMYEFFSNLSPTTVVTLCGLFLFKALFKKLIALHLGQAFREGLNEALTGSATTSLLQSVFINLGTKLGGFIKNLKTNIGGAFSNLGAGLVTTFSNIGVKISAIVSSLATKVSTTFSNIGTTIASIMNGTASPAVMQLSGKVSILGGSLTAVISFLTMWNNGWSLSGEILKDVGIAVAALGAVMLGAAAGTAALVAAIVAAVSTIAIYIHDNSEQVKAWVANIKETIHNFWESLKSWFRNAWNNFTDFISDGFDKIRDFVHNFFYELKSFLPDSWDWIVDLFQAKFDWLMDTFANVGTFIKDVMEDVFGGISKVVEDIGAVFGDLIDFIVNVFSGDWEAAWNDVVQLFKDIWDTIVDIVKGPINLVIDVINFLLRAVQDAANFLIRCLNALSFDVPDWVPVVGGKHFGFNISEVSVGQIPQLAQGAVIPPNKEFMAVLGDQKQGTNIETPLKTMIDAFNKALDDRGGSNNGDIIIEIDGKEVFRAIRKQNKEYKNVTGKSAFA
nr:MAG TPA: minor tail protein [Caudoviricetes sp.]